MKPCRHRTLVAIYAGIYKCSGCGELRTVADEEGSPEVIKAIESLVEMSDDPTLLEMFRNERAG